MSRIEKLRKFYENKNVYITGITGFRGPWLALTLIELGANVSGCGLKPNDNSVFNIVKLKMKVPVVFCDVTETAEKSQYLLDIIIKDPDIVFNFVTDARSHGTIITQRILSSFGHNVNLVNINTSKQLNSKDKEYEQIIPVTSSVETSVDNILGGGDLGYNHITSDILNALNNHSILSH